MTQKDKVEKLLEEHNDVFADIVNVLLFDGKEIVMEDSLEDMNIMSQYKADDGMLHEQERDVAKRWKTKDVAVAIYAIENQTKAEKVMPLRILGYDGASYRSQLLKKNHKDLQAVVSIVLYFGKGHWNQPKSLKKVLHIPKELDKYVNDYYIHVFEISWLTEKQVAMFKSDFRIVAEYFTQNRKYGRYQPDLQAMKHWDEVLKFLAVFDGNQELGKVDLIDLPREERNMESALNRLVSESKRKGRDEGRTEGRVEGRVEGEARSFLQLVENLQENLQLSLEGALKAVGKTLEDYENAKAILKK